MQKKCNSYPERDYCAGSACLWFDANKDTCFIENPSVQPQKSWKTDSKMHMSGKRQTVYEIVHQLNRIQMKKLLMEAEKEEITRRELTEILGDLEDKGLVYCPKPGVIGCVDE